MDCSVCYQAFNLTDNIPKILPCAHTFCKYCIDRSQQSGDYDYNPHRNNRISFNCHTCRALHKVADVKTNEQIVKIIQENTKREEAQKFEDFTSEQHDGGDGHVFATNHEMFALSGAINCLNKPLVDLNGVRNDDKTTLKECEARKVVLQVILEDDNQEKVDFIINRLNSRGLLKLISIRDDKFTWNIYDLIASTKTVTAEDDTKETGGENDETTGHETTGDGNQETAGGRNRETTGDENRETTGGRNHETTGGRNHETTGGRNHETTGGRNRETTGGRNHETTGGRNSYATGRNGTYRNYETNQPTYRRMLPLNPSPALEEDNNGQMRWYGNPHETNQQNAGGEIPTTTPRKAPVVPKQPKTRSYRHNILHNKKDGTKTVRFLPKKGSGKIYSPFFTIGYLDGFYLQIFPSGDYHSKWKNCSIYLLHKDLSYYKMCNAKECRFKYKICLFGNPWTYLTGTEEANYMKNPMVSDDVHTDYNYETKSRNFCKAKHYYKKLELTFDIGEIPRDSSFLIKRNVNNNGQNLPVLPPKFDYKLVFDALTSLVCDWVLHYSNEWIAKQTKTSILFVQEIRNFGYLLSCTNFLPVEGGLMGREILCDVILKRLTECNDADLLLVVRFNNLRSKFNQYLLPILLDVVSFRAGEFVSNVKNWTIIGNWIRSVKILLLSPYVEDVCSDDDATQDLLRK